MDALKQIGIATGWVLAWLYVGAASVMAALFIIEGPSRQAWSNMWHDQRTWETEFAVVAKETRDALELLHEATDEARAAFAVCVEK